MLNQVMLVGRLAEDIELKKENEIEYATINLAVPRYYKNENGEYETDFIKCELEGNIAINTNEYCKKGDIIGIKGRIETENENYVQKVVAEKVTFLSSSKKED